MGKLLTFYRGILGPEFTDRIIRKSAEKGNNEDKLCDLAIEFGKRQKKE